MAQVTIHWSDEVQPGEITALFGMSSREAELLTTALDTGGITQMTVTNGHLTATTVNGAVIDLGDVTGPQGEPGEPGPQGSSAQAPHLLSFTLPAGSWSAGSQQAQVVASSGHVCAVRPAQDADELMQWGAGGVFCSVEDGVLTATVTGSTPTVDLHGTIWWWDSDPSQTTVTIPATGWSDDLTRQVQVPGLYWRDNWTSPADADAATQWTRCGLMLSHDTSGALTARVTQTPSEDFSIIVTIW